MVSGVESQLASKWSPGQFLTPYSLRNSPCCVGRPNLLLCDEVCFLRHCAMVTTCVRCSRPPAWTATTPTWSCACYVTWRVPAARPCSPFTRRVALACANERLTHFRSSRRRYKSTHCSTRLFCWRLLVSRQSQPNAFLLNSRDCLIPQRG